MKPVICTTLSPRSFALICLRFALLLTLCACVSTNLPQMDEAPRTAGRTGLSGHVTDREGGAAAGAYVFAYRSAASGLRGPADFEALVDETGAYFLDLSSGVYHIVARKRSSGSDNGPPRPGDDWGFFSKNPVKVEEGFTTFADLRLAGSGRPMLARRGEAAEKNATLSGKVLDAGGDPVSGIYVLAYRDADYKGSPAFVSPLTDAEGRFSLAVVGPGTYCLVARSQTRGQPARGELYGPLEGGGCMDVGAGGRFEAGVIVVTLWK